MKVYADTYNKDVKAHVLYVDGESLLYTDEDCTVGVTANEIFDMFVTGILVFVNDTYKVPIALTLANEDDDFASLLVGDSTYYTSEHEETPG